MGKKRRTLPATVKKVIKSPVPSEPEKAQIDIHEADDLYREIRVENIVTDEQGQKSKLKEGQPVDVVIEADSDPALKKPENH